MHEVDFYYVFFRITSGEFYHHFLRGSVLYFCSEIMEMKKKACLWVECGQSKHRRAIIVNIIRKANEWKITFYIKMYIVHIVVTESH